MVLLNHIVLRRDCGVEQPRTPLLYSVSISSSSIACLSYGLLPFPCLFSCRYFAFSASLVREKKSPLDPMIAQGYWWRLSFPSILEIMLLSEAGSYSEPSAFLTDNIKFANSGSSSSCGIWNISLDSPFCWRNFIIFCVSPRVLRIVSFCSPGR